MKAAYLKAHHEFELRDVSLPELPDDEVLVKVNACGFCGHDKILADYRAEDWEPFGHEFAGVVEKTGSKVTNLKAGDRVVVMTSMFVTNPLSDFVLDGRPDLAYESLVDYVNRPHVEMGFSERTLVPECLCYKFDGISDEEACFAEPMGVAADLVKTADIKLGNDVVLMGCGAIGLMALQMARASGARKIWAVELSGSTKKAELALEYGADEVIFSDEVDLQKYPWPKGGVDRVLVTTPPKTIDLATRICRPGGIVAFLGIGYGERGMVTFDSNVVHLNKLQIRGSNAMPALYFPFVFDMMHAGFVKVDKMITNTFSLDEAPEALKKFLDDQANTCKAVMINK